MKGQKFLILYSVHFIEYFAKYFRTVLVSFFPLVKSRSEIIIGTLSHYKFLQLVFPEP